MTSRRTLLLGVAGTLVGTRLLAACSAETANEIVSATPAPSPDARSSVPTSNAAAATTVSSTTSPSRAQTWEGADFSGLDSFIERTNGEAFAIWEGGSMIHEWYRTDSSYTRDVASAQKSILSLLFGRAIGDALVRLQTPIDDVLGARWTPSGQSAGITVEHLLTMTSGLDDQRQVVAAPGERWIYSGAFAALFDVLTTATGRDLSDVAQEWLFSPSGATGSIFYERPAGLFAPIGLRSTVPDLIAIGRTMLEGGAPGLAPDWLDRSFASSQSLNRSYGLLWWLNGQDTFMLPGRDAQFRGPIVPAAPADMVAAWGKDDQKMYVVPDRQLVVARLGGRAVPASHPAWSSFDVELWERLSLLRG